MGNKWLTPQEVNALLPFVRNDIRRLQETKSEFIRNSQRLHELTKKQGQNVANPASDEVFRLEAGMEFLQMEAKTLADSIRMKGGELKDIDEGLVDFPGIIDGKEVWLCWKLGEEQVGFYHGMDEGFRSRKALEPEE